MPRNESDPRERTVHTDKKRFAPGQRRLMPRTSVKHDHLVHGGKQRVWGSSVVLTGQLLERGVVGRDGATDALWPRKIGRSFRSPRPVGEPIGCYCERWRQGVAVQLLRVLATPEERAPRLCSAVFMDPQHLWVPVTKTKSHVGGDQLPRP